MVYSVPHADSPDLSGLGAVEINTKIYAIGGGLVAGLRPSGIMEVFTP